ncbi:MAG: riboflavin synthase subunit beta [Nonlabens sp.]
MGILSKRKNKKFDYEPRYLDMDSDNKPFHIKHKFDDHRSTVGRQNFLGKVDNAVNDFSSGVDPGTKIRLYIIIGILLLIFLWIIDFDLSIFKF